MVFGCPCLDSSEIIDDGERPEFITALLQAVLNILDEKEKQDIHKIKFILHRFELDVEVNFDIIGDENHEVRELFEADSTFRHLLETQLHKSIVPFNVGTTPEKKQVSIEFAAFTHEPYSGFINFYKTRRTLKLSIQITSVK